MILSKQQRDEAIALASRSHVSSAITGLRMGGQILDAADTDTLLMRAVARERVELDLEVLAYEQGAKDSDGNVIRNRNNVRFRDGAMMRLGRSGRGAPFIRDHRQGDSLARSGTVVDSRTEKVDEGHYRVLQTVRLSDPSAVERALRGLMTGVSIGWATTGPVLCTSCRIEVLSRAAGKICNHLPGDTDDEGNPVEWEYQEADLVETSEVPIPAVQSAGIDGIRAALSAVLSSATPAQEPNMKIIATTLGLAATAGEEEIVATLATINTEREALRAQLAAANTRAAELNARLETHEAALALQAENAWIAEGITAGKITRGAHESAMRAYFKSDQKGARAMLDAAPRISPVGLPSQLAATDNSTAAPATARTVLESQGVDYAAARKAAAKFGAKNPDKALEALASRMTEAQ